MLDKATRSARLSLITTQQKERGAYKEQVGCNRYFTGCVVAAKSSCPELRHTTMNDARVGDGAPLRLETAGELGGREERWAKGVERPGIKEQQEGKE